MCLADILALEDTPFQDQTVYTPMEQHQTTIVPVDGLFQVQHATIRMMQHVTPIYIVLLADPFQVLPVARQVHTELLRPVHAIIIARGEGPSQVPPVVPLVRTGHQSLVLVPITALRVVPFQVPGAIQVILPVVVYTKMRRMKK